MPSGIIGVRAPWAFPMLESTAVVIQCFVKPDTLQGLMASLIGCAGTESIDLLFWCDGVAGSRREAEFTSARDAVLTLVREFAGIYAQRFRSITVCENETNLGPYRTCQLAIDHAFKDHEFAIFAEDDVFFSRDALLWFASARDLLIQDESFWAIAGESIYFDARDKTPDQVFVERAVKIASERHLLDKFGTLDFIPSSCFATSRSRWSEFGSTRGQPRGDFEVIRRCKQEGRRCAFPLVPRAKDVGMLHDFGYSVTLHTKEGVRSVKNTYLLADDLLPQGPLEPPRLEPFRGDPGALFAETTLRSGG